jgi:hypothetical protein
MRAGEQKTTFRAGVAGQMDGDRAVLRRLRSCHEGWHAQPLQQDSHTAPSTIVIRDTMGFGISVFWTLKKLAATSLASRGRHEAQGKVPHLLTLSIKPQDVFPSVLILTDYSDTLGQPDGIRRSLPRKLRNPGTS